MITVANNYRAFSYLIKRLHSYIRLSNISMGFKPQFRAGWSERAANANRTSKQKHADSMQVPELIPPITTLQRSKVKVKDIIPTNSS